jgi:rubredoxin
MSEPIPMLLWCPECGDRHIDMGEFATKVHHTHACQSCGMVWRPAVVPTVGVTWLPGFKNDTKAAMKSEPEYQAQLKWARDVVSNVIIPPAPSEEGEPR